MIPAFRIIDRKKFVLFHSKHLFLSIEKAERLNARQLRSYYGVISVFYAEEVLCKK